MSDWKELENKIKLDLKNGRFSSALLGIDRALERFPGQFDVIQLAANVCFKSHKYKRCLRYSKYLIKNYSNRWQGYGFAAQASIALSLQGNAEKFIEAGLSELPADFKLLVIANSIYCEINDCDKRLLNTIALIENHPGRWQGYGFAAEACIALKLYDDAERYIEQGLNRWPSRFQLLTIANSIYCEINDCDKRLLNAAALIKNHSERWQGYGFSAEAYIALKLYDDAERCIERGLNKWPSSLRLLIIANDIYRASRDYEKGLQYSKSLIAYFPGKWYGYGLSSQNFVSLDRLDEALLQVKAGLKVMPNEWHLLHIAMSVYRRLGDSEKSLSYAEDLIKYYPDKCQGYADIAQILFALKRFTDAARHIKHGLNKFPKNVRLLELSAKVLFALEEYKECLEISRFLISSFKSNCHGYLSASQALVALHDLDEAHAFINEGLSVLPNNYALLNERGRIFFLQEAKLDFAVPVQLTDHFLDSSLVPRFDLLKSIPSPQVAVVKQALCDIQVVNSDAKLLLFRNACVSAPYGVHDELGNPFWHSYLSRGQILRPDDYPYGIPVGIDTSALVNLTNLSAAFYINFPFFAHFGHLLTETASSLSYLLWMKELVDELPDFLPLIVPQVLPADDMQKLKDLLGVKSDRIIRAGGDSLHVDYLFSSVPTIVNRRFSSKCHSRAVRSLIALMPSQAKDVSVKKYCADKIYISRSKLSADKRLICGEALLERLLQAEGWSVFHPQEHDLQTQIEVYESAHYISSTNSSSLHLLYGVRTDGIRKIVLLSPTATNSFTIQFDSQSIPYDNINCLENLRTCSKDGASRDLVFKSDFTVEAVFRHIVEGCLE